jgi:outer membrane immunogenic protein
MKKFIALALAATTLAASPAFAQDTAVPSFSGPRVGANVGFADDDAFGTETFTYAGNVGYDANLGNAVVGITGEYQDSEDSGRDLSIVGRVGAPLGSSALIYGLAGYTNLGVGSGTGIHLDGYRVGGGVEVGMGRNLYLNVEQRYSNYEAGVDGFQTVAGIGFRF